MRVVYVQFDKGNEPGDQATVPDAIAAALIDAGIVVADPADVKPEPAKEKAPKK